MYTLLAKKGQLFSIILGVVVIAIYFISVFTGLNSSGYTVSDDLNQIMKNNPDQEFSFFNAGLMITLILVVVAAVIALLFGIWQLVSTPKNSIKAIVFVGAILAVFFAMYTMADSDLDGPISLTLQKFNVGEQVSRLISGGLWSSIILAVLALGSMVVFEVYNLFK